MDISKHSQGIKNLTYQLMIKSLEEEIDFKLHSPELLETLAGDNEPPTP